MIQNDLNDLKNIKELGLILLLKQRRWRCSNPDCLYEVNESFRFVNKGRRTTNATDMLIVEAYRNLLETSASIAKRFHILQDGYSLILLLKQRRWRCSNPDCLYEVNESFRFVNKGRRTTNATDMLIVEAYRNLLETSASIAKRFHIQKLPV